MNDSILVAIISGACTLIGSCGGVIASSRLTQYRLAQLEKQDYDRYRDALADRDSAYEKLVALMRTYRYMPTQEEMDAAGLTEAQRKAILGR